MEIVQDLAKERFQKFKDLVGGHLKNIPICIFDSNLVPKVSLFPVSLLQGRGRRETLETKLTSTAPCLFEYHLVYID